MSAYLTDVVNTYQNGFKLSIDIPLLGVKESETQELDQIVDNDTKYSNCNKL